MNGRHADSVLQVQLLPAGGYRLALLGPEPQQHTALLRHRLPGLQPFVQVAERQLRRLGHHQASFALQLHDEQPRPLCFRFDAPLQADGLGPLIPDPYVLASEGYAGLRARFASEPLPPWHERLPIAIWRGSSTGSAELSLANLAENRRYQLCRRSLELPHRLDARLSALVQCPDPAGVSERLHREGLLAPRLDPWHLALHRWIVEIDGNVNSWGLLWKLLSGSCVLRVASSRRQWYHHRLEPWRHVVPVAADLGDLEAVLDWCHRHPSACAAIAQAGQQLALTVIAELELAMAEAVGAYAANWLRTPAA